MNSHHRLGLVAIVLALLLTACGQPTPSGLVGDGAQHQEVASKAPRGKLVVIPSYDQAQRKVQAVVTPYTKDSIDHVLIALFTVNGDKESLVTDETGKPLTAEVAKADLDKPVTFSNLYLYTFYRVKCFAFKAPGNDAANLISTVDSASQTLIVVTSDDRPAMAPLKVKLIDIPFDGEATASGIVVTPGGFSHPREAINAGSQS